MSAQERKLKEKEEEEDDDDRIEAHIVRIVSPSLWAMENPKDLRN